MAVVEWIGQSLRDDDNAQANTSRLLNMYRERHGDGYTVKSVLGMTTFASFTGVFLRALAEVGGVLYAVVGGKVYSITSGAGTAELATVNDAVDTTIDGNNGAITVSAGGEYYNIDSGGVVTTPTTGAFSDVGSVSFLGQRTIITEKDGRRFGWSDVADSTTFDALDFATAENEDDLIIRGLAIGPQYWIFGERSIERWYQSGSANTSEFLLPISGGAIETGLKAFGLLTEMRNGAFFVGNDNIAYLISGGSLIPVSTRGVETAIEQSQPNKCFYYEDEGHKFCVLQFNDRPAWCYDVSVNEWHERCEGADFGPWAATASAQAYGAWYVGNDFGDVLRLQRTNLDAGEPLFRRAVSTTLENDGQRFTINRAQFQPQTGFGNDAGGAPEIMFRFSRDRGQTWGRERWRDVGADGDYDKLVTLRALGRFRRATAEVTMSTPVDIPISSQMFLEVT
ncbi:MAG: putative packaged DNA stabilization protein [Prokaryotic dsDNA virus sp.]|nr:MAG: putative packaged DNA stabilization protein [Prokaryotic dsDNA virus sp.]QDP53129.1 MAG: putative packaged DNA stabilization protein [Prokaryotic dsDNA virus sp.]|tara:strand:+ start:5655 stop:7013 length:1359 start_codon:yes stop_codon:yes gene_type:complete